MKSSSEIQLQIERLESEESLHRSRLEGMMPHIRQELLPPAEKWVREELQKQRDSNPHAIVALGAEKLSLLKKDFNALCESLPGIIEASTFDVAKWPHNLASTPASAEDFHRMFRTIVNHLGPILEEYKLVPVGGGARTWHRGHDGKLHAGVANSLSTLSVSMNSYIMTERELREISKQLDKAKKDLLAAKANELWEAAE